MEVAPDSIMSEEMAPQNLMTVDMLSLRVFVGLLVGLRHAIILLAYVMSAMEVEVAPDSVTSEEMSSALGAHLWTCLISPRMFVARTPRWTMPRRAPSIRYYDISRGDGDRGPHGGGHA